MTKIIALTQLKGGCGRSTVASNLAGELSKIGKTLLVDCDVPQGTSSSWFAIRQEKGLHSNLEATTANSASQLMKRVEQKADYIILDTPPRLAEITRVALVASDLCLIPVGASPAELWATGDLVELIQEAEKVRKVTSRIVWTRYRSNTKLAQELSELAGKELGLKALKTTMGMRVAYVNALSEGLTGAEVGDAAAKRETQALVAEIRKLK